jgi:hypothetical protein
VNQRSWIREFAFGLALVALPGNLLAEPVEIGYFGTELEGGRWRYAYEVTNQSLAQAVAEFTIWFEVDVYDNLLVETLDPPAADWDELVVQPDPILHDDGFYDALTLEDGILTGESAGWFRVSFDWLGEGMPGPQAFDIIDPDTFEPLYSGTTVFIPEPSSGVLLIIFLILFTLRRRWRRR